MPSPNEPKGFFQYLPRTQHDQIAGLYITDYGWTEIAPNMPYPPWKHPTEFAFTNGKGRCLDEYQLVHIYQGSGTFWSKQTGSIKLSAGSLFLLFPGVRHKYSPNPETGWNEQWFGFKGDVAERLMNAYFSAESPVFSPGIKSTISSLFERLKELAQKHQIGYRRIMATTAQEILIQLQVSTEADQYSVDNEIELACQYIEEHFKHAIDFKEYAKSTGHSYSTFRRRFKKHTGKALNQYLLNTKIRNAKQLLDNSDLSVQEIAQECGFESPYYFSRYFKASVGISPKQYRTRWESEHSNSPQ